MTLSEKFCQPHKACAWAGSSAQRQSAHHQGVNWSKVGCRVIYCLRQETFGLKKISHVNSMCGAMGLIPHIAHRKAHKANENEEDEVGCLRSDRW